MLDFHWIKAMLFFCKYYDFLQFFRKYYDFLQFFLHYGIFFPAILSAVVFFQKYNGRWENTMSKNRL